MGNRLNFKDHRAVYGHRREYDRGVGYKSPLDMLTPVMCGIKQCSHTFGEQHDGHP